VKPAAVGDNASLSFHQSPVTLTPTMINAPKIQEAGFEKA